MTTDGAGSIIAVYSDHPVNGTVKKIAFDAGNMTATGSLYVRASGAVLENIWSYNALDTDVVAYPFVYPVGANNLTGSPQAFTERIINTPLLVTGQGMGGGKSGLGLIIYYI